MGPAPDPCPRRQVHRTLVLVNQGAGGVASAREQLAGLGSRLGDGKSPVEVHVVGPGSMPEILSERLGPEPTLVVVGGGDGTLQCVAELLADTDHVLGVLPLGTINRFARALGIPTTLDGAVEALLSGRDQAVGLGEVNGHLFLNTCSLGLYPDLARAREERRRRHPHWPKFLRWTLDTVAAGWRVLKCWRLIRFRLDFDQRFLSYRLPTLLIANSPLPSDPASHDPASQGGALAVYIPRVLRPLGLLWLMLKVVIWGPNDTELLEVFTTKELDVQVPPGTSIAVDGELVALRSPLRLRYREGACHVRVPAGVPEGT